MSLHIQSTQQYEWHTGDSSILIHLKISEILWSRKVVTKSLQYCSPDLPNIQEDTETVLLELLTAVVPIVCILKRQRGNQAVVTHNCQQHLLYCCYCLDCLAKR